MHEAGTIGELRAWRRAQREQGRRVALVPTMGYLHEGHLALVDVARAEAEAVAMSIFVNPLQFGPNEDLARYPRNIARDRALARERGVDLLFVPDVAEMYPEGAEVRVVAGETASRWEGLLRPGHFDGVLTVVAKLFHLVEPDLAVFGQKDIQQVTLVRRMVEDLDWPVRIVAAPIVRDPDGLALSSRNVYLSPEERVDALALNRSLAAAQEAFASGERNADVLRRAVRSRLEAQPQVAVDYIAVVEPDRLAPVAEAAPGTIVAIAARVGSTRLIDNVILSEA
ncbi:MAG TPA: pantoate--beta-alanine ligase [Gemmatimonadales bacterium]|nr:pantoate--beta-alanine ligase [Gemmatimonadales bacterium]